MAKRFSTGLVVGKFAPLHRGHEFVIETARQQCELLIALSYSKPELPRCEPARRRAWLEARFPDVRVLVLGATELGGCCADFVLPSNDAAPEEHRSFVARVCHELLGVRVDAVFTSESYGQPFADSLTRHFESRGLRAHPPVAHVAVDPERHQLPISGTTIRSAPYEHRHWLDPLVYASLIRRVVLLGAESSGKTILARALAHAHQTRYVEEYGRELWFTRGGKLDAADLLAIAREQVQREERALPSCRDSLFCDTSPLTTALYSRLMFGEIPPELEQFARREYDLTVYCVPDFPFVQDGTRIGPEFRAQQDALTRAELEKRGIPHLEVRGPVESRVGQVLSALDLGGASRR